MIFLIKIYNTGAYMSMSHDGFAKELQSIKTALVSARRAGTITFFSPQNTASHISNRCIHLETALTENRIQNIPYNKIKAEKTPQDIEDILALASHSAEKRKQELIKSLTKEDVQNYLNIEYSADEKIKRIETILISKFKIIIRCIPKEDITYYIETNNSTPFEVRLGHIFATKVTSIINFLDMNYLFNKITHESQSKWLVEKVLASKKTDPIQTLVTMGKLSQYLTEPSEVEIKRIIASSNRTAIELLMQRDWDKLAELTPSYIISIRTLGIMTEKSRKRVPPSIARNTCEKHQYSDKKTAQLPGVQKNLVLLKQQSSHEEHNEIPGAPIQNAPPPPVQDKESKISKSPSPIFFHPHEDNSPDPKPKTPLILSLRMSPESYFRYKASPESPADHASRAPKKRRRLDSSTPPVPQPSPRTKPIESYNPLTNPSHPTPRR